MDVIKKDEPSNSLALLLDLLNSALSGRLSDESA